MKRRRIAIFVKTAFAVALSVCNARAQGVTAASCKLTPIGEAKVTAVYDDGTLMLGDGRELKLAGIEVAGGSRDAMQTLASGQVLRLERLGPEADRYGRLVAFAFPGDSRQSLQTAC